MLSENEIIIALATIAAFGIGCQWIGRRLGFPSLLLLLPAGLLAGDVLGLVEPDKLLGDTLFPLVTLLVALLLFQSGLQLRFADLPDAARVPVYRLITIGLAITFLGASLAALAILDIDTGLAFLLGAIIVVSGPTVVGPLLSTVRAREPTGSVLNYEGTFLDPIGATLGVIVLNLVLANERGGDVHPLLQAAGRLGIGIVAGLVAAALLIFVMSRFMLTDDMQAAVAVMFAVAAFAASDTLLSEAGLFATLTLGVVLANQDRVSIRRITGFGETLEVLIIGALFILLGALVTLDGLEEYAWEIVLLVLALVLIVRPLTAAVSLVATKLTWHERALIGWVDPRGIVAASTAATFTGTLAAAKLDSDFLLPVVFGVILGTGIIYGLTAKPVAQLLNLTKAPAKGVGLLGNAPWIVELARQLQNLGVSVLVQMGKPPDVVQAEADSAGVPIVSIGDTEAELEEAFLDADLAQMVVCAPSGVLTNLFGAAVVERMGRRGVLRLPDRPATGAVSGRVLEDETLHPFHPRASLQDITERVDAGAVVEVIDDPTRDDVLPLAAVRPDGTVNLQPGRDAPAPEDTVVGLVGGHSGPSAGDDGRPAQTTDQREN
ncbi:MAG: cation:proton antiporter [Thermoleophilia bacterium]|nr:cation:proton antiporter [Thermoleophilia bacterium]